VEPLVTKLAQIGFAGFAFGRGVFRIFRNTELKLEIDPVGDDQRVRDRLGMIGKERTHFIR
jgi:hypothetical protein